MASKDSVPIHEGQPSSGLGNQRWVRLVVRQQARAEDKEAERLLQAFAKALTRSEYADEFVLSIFRISPEQEQSFGLLPKIENEPGIDGIDKVRRYLSMYTEDVAVPLAC
jgi:hypothetical protein